MSKTPFRDSLIYPIVFVLAISVVFVGILAVLYRSNEAKIMNNRLDSYQKMVLQLMSVKIGEAAEIKPFWLMNNYPASYHEYIREIKVPGLDRRCFQAVVNSQTVALCFEINGKGLWGTMTALAAFDPEVKTLLGLAIYDQMETPGLGARIEESWFLDQFNNIGIIKANPQTNDYVIDFSLIPEGKKAADPSQIQQVTGATITSRSVIQMLKTEINAIYANHLQQVQK